MDHADFPTRISLDEALAIIGQVSAARRPAAERVPTSRADGRVLAADVVAPVALPGFDNSAMDGFALRHADLHPDAATALRLAGEQFAGRDLGLAPATGQCVRITTGAPMPEGTDTVLIKESAVLDGDMVLVPAGLARGANVRRRAEDVQVGDVVLHAGQVLSPARIGLAASLGIDRLAVSPRPTVAVFASGDELVEPGLPLQPGQVYNSNRDQLMAQLRGLGLEPVAWPTLPDDPARIAAVLDDAVDSFDVVVTCGGVSAGEKDHLPPWLRARGRPDDGGWRDEDLVCRTNVADGAGNDGAGSAVAATDAGSAGDGLDRLIRRIDADPMPSGRLLVLHGPPTRQGRGPR